MFDFEDFFNKLRVGEVYFDDFPEERLIRFKDKTYPLLLKSIENKDEGLLSDVLSVLFYDGADSDFTSILLDLLKKDWHFSHEDIVQILDIIKDPSSIEALYSLTINVPDEDEMRSLAKKCIYALGSIKTSESIEKLMLLEKLEDEIIKEHAGFILEKIKPKS